MGLNVLGIAASPRAKSNSTRLLQEALQGAASVGTQTELIELRTLKIAGCLECNNCRQSGSCIIKDDFQLVLEKMLAADRIYFATPIFFMNVSAQAKLLIDRCQCLWALKTVLKKAVPHTSSEPRLAMVIAVGGSKSLKMFDSVRWTVRSWLDVLNMTYAAGLYINQVDDAGDIEKHPTAIKEAFDLGRKVAQMGAPAEKPLEPELK